MSENRGPDGGWGLVQRVVVRTLVAAVSLTLAGCPDRAGEGTPSAAASDGRTAASAGRSLGTTGPRPVPPGPPSAAADEPVETVDDEGEIDPQGACAPADPGLKPMELLRFTFADGVERKDPREKLNIARPGQRVYAHLKLRNRSGRDRCVHVVFRVGGKKRTDVTLKVGESWSWRTWAYNTLRADDSGQLQVVVTDDQGKVIVQQSLAVVPE